MTRPDADMHDREALEQLVALDVYGELDPDERTRLDAALGASPDLRRYAESMRATLGRLADDAESTRVDDNAWTEEVRLAIRATDASPSRRITPSLAAGILGFAAGLALMAAVQASAPPRDTQSSPAVSSRSHASETPDSIVDATPPAATGFERATAPPRARLGSLSRLGDYLGS